MKPNRRRAKRLAAALAQPLLLSACFAPMDAARREPTLADLDSAATLEQPTPAPPSATEAAQQVQRAITATDEPAVQQQLRGQLADLDMRSGEATQGSQQQEVKLYRLAIAQYQAILDSQPGDPGNDRVHYQLAKAYELAGEPEQALTSLRAVTRYCPASAYCAEAHFRSGEILFSQRNYPAAQAAYRAAIKAGPDTAFYRNAVYMLGWTQFKLADYPAALTSFSGILDGLLAGQRTPEQLTPAERELLQDSLRVVALIFYSQEGAATLESTFGGRGPAGLEPMIYAALADLYLEKQRYSDAAGTYEAFLQRHPESELAVEFSLRAADAYAQGALPGMALSVKQRFVEQHGIHSRHWTTSTSAARAELLPQLNGMLRELATSAHARGQALGLQNDEQADRASRQAYREAARWYAEFAETFPDDPATPEMTFLQGEALFEATDYEEAIAAYERVAYAVPHQNRGAEAAYAAILAYDALIADAAGGTRRDWQRRRIDSILRFAESYPLDPRSAEALVQASQALLALGDHAGAAELAATTFGRLPASAGSDRLACRLVQGDALFELGDYHGAELAYTEALQLMPQGDERRPATADRLAASIYQSAEQSLAAGDRAASVAQFLRIDQVAGQSGIATQAQFDAAAVLVQQQAWPEAEAQLIRLRRDYPNHPLAAGLAASLSEVYLQQDKWAPAADEFSRIAQTSDDVETRANALYMAATLYQRANQPDAAIDHYRRYVDQYPERREQACEARYQIAELHHQAGRETQRRVFLRQLIDTTATGDTPLPDRCHYLAAAAESVFADDAYRQFLAIELTPPLKANLARKRQALAAALNAYEKLLGYEIQDFVTLATYRMGDLYRQLGLALMDSERPPSLNPLELEQYELMLEEQAYPFEEQAIAIHEVNAQRIALGIYDEWTRQSLADLADLLPTRYSRGERVIEYSTRLN